MRVNGEAIYATGASPMPRFAQRVTHKPGRLFVHLHQWPGEGMLELPGLMNPVDGARLLAGGAALEVSGEPGMWRVRLPAEAPDPRVSVVEIRYAGDLRIDDALRPDAAGVLTLPAAAARIEGSRLALEHEGRNLGFWTDDADRAFWDFNLPEGGTFRVDVEAACADASAGSAFAVTIVDQMVRGEVPATGGWTEYRILTPGAITIPHGGAYRLELRARKADGAEAVMNVRSIRLVPAD